ALFLARALVGDLGAQGQELGEPRVLHRKHDIRFFSGAPSPHVGMSHFDPPARRDASHQTVCNSKSTNDFPDLAISCRGARLARPSGLAEVFMRFGLVGFSLVLAACGTSGRPDGTNGAGNSSTGSGGTTTGTTGGLINPGQTAGSTSSSTGGT